MSETWGWVLISMKHAGPAVAVWARARGPDASARSSGLCSAVMSTAQPLGDLGPAVPRAGENPGVQTRVQPPGRPGRWAGARVPLVPGPRSPALTRTASALPSGSPVLYPEAVSRSGHFSGPASEAHGLTSCPPAPGKRLEGPAPHPGPEGSRQHPGWGGSTPGRADLWAPGPGLLSRCQAGTTWTSTARRPAGPTSRS